jgi:hypothetical protein
LLIVLQGMDTAGKDGTISHIFPASTRRAAMSPPLRFRPSFRCAMTSCGASIMLFPSAA